MKNKKLSKKNQKIKEKKNLDIANYGDVIVIRNRSVIASSVLTFIMLSLFVAGAVVMKEAWELPMFRVVFAAILLGAAYSLANIFLSKIVLDSPNMLMNVYNPFKKQYKFEDINYIDVDSSEPKDGIVLHSVIVYIGKGKRTVEITTMSSKQADELVTLLRGMLDNGAMVFPEGDEEPFTFDDDKKKKASFFLGSKKNKKEETEDETEFLISKKVAKAEKPTLNAEPDKEDKTVEKESDKSESDNEVAPQFILKDKVERNDECPTDSKE